MQEDYLALNRLFGIRNIIIFLRMYFDIKNKS